MLLITSGIKCLTLSHATTFYIKKQITWCVLVNGLSYHLYQILCALISITSDQFTKHWTFSEVAGPSCTECMPDSFLWVVLLSYSQVLRCEFSVGVDIRCKPSVQCDRPSPGAAVLVVTHIPSSRLLFAKDKQCTTSRSSGLENTVCKVVHNLCLLQVPLKLLLRLISKYLL